MNDFNFRLWFQRQLKNRNMTLKDFSRISGFGYVAVSHWVNGYCSPTLNSFLLILDAFGMKMNITGGETE